MVIFGALWKKLFQRHVNGYLNSVLVKLLSDTFQLRFVKAWINDGYSFVLIFVQVAFLTTHSSKKYIEKEKNSSIKLS